MQSADLALAIYLEPLALERRALWLGDPSGGGPRRLSQTAALFKVLSPDGGRVDGLRVSRLKPGPLIFREGSFDLIVAPDIGRVGLGDPERIAELRQALAQGGCLVLGTSAEPKGEGLGYEGLFDLVAERFRSTRMLGQACFDAWAVVDFAASENGAPEVVVDGSAIPVDGDRPIRHLALASDATEHATDAYTVVRVPERRRPQSSPVTEDVSVKRDLGAELETALDRSEELEGKVADLERSLASRTADLKHVRGAFREADEDLATARATLRESEAPTRGSDSLSEHERLEASLRKRSQELRDARTENERLEVFSRDAIEQLKSNGFRGVHDFALSGVAAAPGSPESATGAALAPEAFGATLPPAAQPAWSQAATERAVAAEAARAAAEFEADELRGQLLDNEREGREMAVEEARLAGRVRGLRARLAELGELRESAEARVSLVTLDLDEARRRARDLQRELGLVTGRVEGGRSPSWRAPAGAFGGSVSVRAGGSTPVAMGSAHAEIAGLRSRLGDRQAALLGVRREAEAAISLRRRLAEAQQQAGQVRAELGEARAKLDDQDGLEKRAKEAEAETDRLRQSLPARPATFRPEGRASEVDALRSDGDEMRKRLEEVAILRDRGAQQIAELTSVVAARDALVSRLQMDLAGSERRRDDFDEQMDRLREENRRLRDALVEASGSVDAVDALQNRLSSAEEMARRHEEALNEARGRVDGQRDAMAAAERERDYAREQRESLRRELEHARELLRQTLREVRQGLDGLSGVLGADATTTLTEITAVGIGAPHDSEERAATADELEALRERIDVLRSEAADRDTLIHSATAQLEERDDRIRALEGRLANAEGPRSSDEALHTEVLELRERSARLAEELEHERRARAIAGSAVAGKNGPSAVPGEGSGTRIVDVDEVSSSLQGKERELKGLREANAQARAGLEELLGAATMSDPATAERIGALLRILR